MSVLYDLGIVPYGGGTLNITAANSYIHFIDEETFVATYQQTNPYGLILALGKCVGGFDVGTPEIVYQELISQTHGGNPLITKLTSNLFLLSVFNKGSSFINMYVFENKGDTLELKTSKLETVSSMMDYVSNHTNGLLSVNYGSGYIQDYACYLYYPTGYNGTTYSASLNLSIIKYDIFTNDIVVTSHTVDTVTKSSSTTNSTPYPVVKLEMYPNYDGEAVLVYAFDIYGYGNSSYNNVSTSYTIKAAFVNYGSDYTEVGTPVTIATAANGFVKIGGELYVLNASKTTISKIDGIDFANGTIGSITSTGFSIGGATANYLEHLIPINSNYILSYRDILGKQASTTGNHSFRVIRKNNSIMEATNYVSVAKSSTGYACALSNITLFNDYFVLPVYRNSTSLSYIVAKP